MADFKYDEKEALMLTWNDNDGKTKAVAFSKMYAALEKSTLAVQRTQASDIYKDIYAPDISIRDEFNYTDYEAYRPSERLPKTPKGKIKAAMEVYYVGIIRNVIDLMGDFTVQGIDLVHPVKKIQAFYKKWWKIVHGKERSERLANYLARTCNVIAQRETKKLPLAKSKQFYKTEGAKDLESDEDKIQLEKREIPAKYTFLNPLTVDVIGGELNNFIDSGNYRFGVNVSDSILQKIRYPSAENRDLVNQLPTEILNAVRSGSKTIPLDPAKIKSSYYKKDDWDLWAVPITCSVLPHIKTLEKMQLADRAALDGAISQIRLWKLGSLEHKILPNEAAINKLANILVNGVGGGIVDLIWGPDIELKESTTTLHNFLGETKYVPVLNAIYAGLGIPPLFTGATNQGSFTNNFLAIKTLIERLQYIRERVIEFWETELVLVQKAMGFEKPAHVTFDRMTLNDEASILQLITGLVDRNIISEEYAQEMVGAIPEIETFRLNREEKERQKGKRGKKTSPFQSPSIDDEYKKLFVQQGIIAPSQVGLDLPKKKPDETTKMDEDNKTKVKVAKFKPVGIAGQGRPRFSKDGKKRKQKQVKPRRSVNQQFLQATLWAEDAQNFISEFLTPVFLKSINKQNLRQASYQDAANFENLKFRTLIQLKPHEKLEGKRIKEILKSPLLVPEDINALLIETLKVYKKQNSKEATLEHRRRLQSKLYALVNSDVFDEETNNTLDGSS